MLALFNIGTPELLIILLILLLLFGRRLPDVMRSMGQGVKEFKKSLREEDAPPAAEAKDKGEAGKGQSPPAG